MRSKNLRRWPLAVALLGSATPLAAQIDYRNLDDDRPVVTEDAYPTEFRAFEFRLPYAFERARGGGDVHALLPEIEYGILRNAAIGVKLPLARAVSGGADEWCVRGADLRTLQSEHRRSATSSVIRPCGPSAADRVARREIIPCRPEGHRDPVLGPAAAPRERRLDPRVGPSARCGGGRAPLELQPRRRSHALPSEHTVDRRDRRTPTHPRRPCAGQRGGRPPVSMDPHQRDRCRTSPPDPGCHRAGSCRYPRVLSCLRLHGADAPGRGPVSRRHHP